MEIFTLLETLEETIENARKMPLTNKGIVDKDELLDLIKEIRIKLPEELKQAKWVKEERTRILIEAQKKAEIIETANEMAREISNGAKEHAEELNRRTNEYADELLGRIEDLLEETLDTVKSNRDELK